MRYDPYVMKLEPGEEIWVRTDQLDHGYEYEVGVQLNKSQFTYLTLNRAQLEQLSTNIHAALLESDT